SGLRRRARLDRWLVCCRSGDRHQRHGRQVLLPGARLIPHLPGDGCRPDLAPGGPVRGALMAAPARPAFEPPPHFEAQARWHPCEIAFWLSTLLPFVLFPNHLVLASQIAITALFALSLDLILGYAGIVSLGHAAFFGLGAYTAGIITKYGWTEPLVGL